MKRLTIIVAVVFLVLLTEACNSPNQLTITPISAIVTKTLNTPNATISRTATWVIAASNATATEKAQADVVCTGSNDNIPIQAAVNAGYRHIVFSSGTFKIATAIQPEAYCMFEGQGWSTIFQPFGNNDIFADPRYLGTSDVVWKNMQFKSDRTKTGTAINIANYCSSTLIDTCFFQQWLHPAVILDYCWGVTLNNCYISLCGDVSSKTGAIQLRASTDVCTKINFDNCIFEPNYYADIDIAPNTTVSHLSIHNCWFETDIGYGPGFNAHIYGHPGSILTQLTIEGTWFAEDVNDSASHVSCPEIDSGLISGCRFFFTNPCTNAMISCANLNCSIIDNNFIVCAGTGIYNNSAGSGNISGNTFTFYGSSGTAISMKMSNARITNNCVYGGEYGIYATFDQYCVFTGNTFNGTSNGIYQGHDVGYTVIEENSFQGVTTPIPYPQPNDSICNNKGYIASGEIRTYSGSIVGSANDNRAIMITIDNSFGQAVRVIKVDVEITVQAMGTATMDCGIGLSNSNDYSTMIAGLPINPGTSYPYFYSSTTTPTYSKQKDAVNWETGSGNRYMNFYNPSENPSGIAFRATYTITIMGN